MDEEKYLELKQLLKESKLYTLDVEGTDKVKLHFLCNVEGRWFNYIVDISNFSDLAVKLFHSGFVRYGTRHLKKLNISEENDVVQHVKSVSKVKGKRKEEGISIEFYNKDEIRIFGDFDVNVQKEQERENIYGDPKGTEESSPVYEKQIITMGKKEVSVGDIEYTTFEAKGKEKDVQIDTIETHEKVKKSSLLEEIQSEEEISATSEEVRRSSVDEADDKLIEEGKTEETDFEVKLDEEDVSLEEISEDKTNDNDETIEEVIEISEDKKSKIKEELIDEKFLGEDVSDRKDEEIDENEKETNDSQLENLVKTEKVDIDQELSTEGIKDEEFEENKGLEKKLLTESDEISKIEARVEDEELQAEKVADEKLGYIDDMIKKEDEKNLEQESEISAEDEDVEFQSEEDEVEIEGETTSPDDEKEESNDEISVKTDDKIKVDIPREPVVDPFKHDLQNLIEKREAGEMVDFTYINNEIFKRLMFHIYSSESNLDNIWSNRLTYEGIFNDFDIDIVSQMTKAEVDILMNNEQIISNRPRLDATIINSQVIKELLNEYNSFPEYLLILLESENNVEEIFAKMKLHGFRWITPVLLTDFFNEIGL